MEKEIMLVISYLDKLGEKLGIGADMLWPYIMKQTLFSGIINAILVVGSSLIFYIFLNKTIKHPMRNDNDWPTDLRIFTALSVVSGTIMAISFLVFITVGFFNIFNTEYMAFKMLVEMLRRL
jgi:hypothetical protein